MAKNKSTDNNDNGYPGENSSVDSVVTPSQENNYQQSESKDSITLVFKKNRKKELHVNKQVYHFYGAGSSVQVPKEVLEHSDFENQRKYFTIKGEK